MEEEAARVQGQREDEGEMDGRMGTKGRTKRGTGGRYGEATEEKTRLHVTGSPEPI